MDIDLSKYLTTQEILDASLEDNLASLLEESDRNAIAAHLVELYEKDAKFCKPRHDLMKKFEGIVKSQEEYRREARVLNGSDLHATLFSDAVTEFQITFTNEFPLDEPIKTEVDFKMPSSEDIEAQLYQQIGQIPPPEAIDEQLKNIKVQFHALQMQAEQAKKTMNYQLTVDMESWQSETEMIGFLLPCHGTVLRKYSFCPIEKRPDHKLVRATDIIVDEQARCVNSAQRISQCSDYKYYELEPLIRKEYFLDIADESQDLDDVVDMDETHYVIEMCVRLDLDDDDYPEPYIVHLDKETKKLLRIEKNFEDIDVLLEPDSNDILTIKNRKRYCVYTFLPDSDSFFGRGLCDILQESQHAISSIVNILIDGGANYTLGGGFVSGDSGVTDGLQQFVPGEWKPVKNFGSALRESIVPLPQMEPSQTLVSMLQFIDSKASSLANLSQFNAENFTSNIAPTVAMIYADKATEKLKAILIRVFRSLTAEIKMLQDANARYINIQRYQFLADISATPEMFKQNQIKFVANKDMENIGNMKMMARTQYLDGKMQDPFYDAKKIRRMSAEGMGFKDPDAFLITPPPPQPNPMAQAQVENMQAQSANLKEQIQVLVGQLQLSQQKQQQDFEVKMRDLEIKMQDAQTKQYQVVAQAEAKRDELALKQVDTASNIEDKQYQRQAEAVAMYNNSQQQGAGYE